MPLLLAVIFALLGDNNCSPCLSSLLLWQVQRDMEEALQYFCSMLKACNASGKLLTKSCKEDKQKESKRSVLFSGWGEGMEELVSGIAGKCDTLPPLHEQLGS